MKSLVSIIPLAAVDSVNVLALLAVSYVWISSASRWAYIRTAASFVVGGVFGLAMTLTFSFTVILRIVRHALDTFSEPVVAGIGLAIAVVIIAVAARGLAKPPASMPELKSVHPALAFGLGLVTWAVQSLTSAPFYGAIAVMSSHGVPARMGLSVVFVLVALLPVTALLAALAVVSHSTGDRLISRVESVLPTASRAVSAILILAATAGAAYAVYRLAT